MKLQNYTARSVRLLTTTNMITENDKIAIGVSGGKDSLTCSMRFPASEAFIPMPFELVAIAVDLGI